MNRQLLITLLLALVVVFSISAVSASEINVTDSYAASDVDESVSLESDDSSQEAYAATVDDDSSKDASENAADDLSDNSLKSEDSNILSTNSEESNVLTSDENQSIENKTTIDPSKTITSKDVTKYYKGSKQYTATFLDNSGKALANTKVKITVNGHSYTKTTDSKGKVSMSINLKPGTYKVVAENPSTGYSLKTTFKILSTITSTKDISKVYTDGKRFYAKFLKSNGKVLAKKTVKFKINGKTYKVKTNSKGVASLSLKNLKRGTYKIISYNTDGLTKVNKVKVVKSTTTSLTASDYTFLKSDSKTIKVKLLNKFGYSPAKGNIVKFKINGKKYQAKTNSKGIAKLKLPSLKVGIYTVKYSFAKTSMYKASSTKSKVAIIPSKTPKFVVKSTTTFGHGAGTPFKVALQSGSVPLANKKVTFTVNGKSYTKTTNSKGMVSLKINLDIGKYTITYKNKAYSKIKSISKSTAITVKERIPTKITWNSATTFDQGTRTVKVSLVDSAGNALSGTVNLNIDSKTYTATTSKGVATFSVSLSPGKVTASYSYGGNNDYAGSSNSTDLTVNRLYSISFKNVLTGATNLKNYIANNNKLPSTVTAGGIKFTTNEFLYVMSKAIEEAGNSKTSAISIIYDISAPSSSTSGDALSSSLTEANYLKLAKNVASYISSNKRAPSYGTTNIGKVGYTKIIDSFSRILAFYKTNNRLPSYVSMSSSSSSSSSQSGTGLNEKNTISDLTKLLKASTNCQVGNAAIKKIVNSLTKGLTSSTAKAKAIFNYVRDTISYSFYYDTKYGAAGTLSSKKGNCVDHSHLLVAMFRTAGLPARYVHGTCTFSSGSTYGHVWTQVLIDGKWTIADATSSRNSLGSVANWNTKSFTLKGIYSSISF